MLLRLCTIFILLVDTLQFKLAYSSTNDLRIFPSQYPVNNEQIIINDGKNNITDGELTKIKQFITQAEGQYLSTQLSKIGKYIFDQLKGPSYQVWNVFVYTGNITDVGIASYHMYQNKYLWIKYGKYNYTYALFSEWICESPVGGGAGSAQFGENMTDDKKQKILDIVNNSIIFKGDSIQDAATYILNKTMMSFSYVWSVMIATPNTTYGYYRCSIYENWAALRAYGEFKWNYYIWAG